MAKNTLKHSDLLDPNAVALVLKDLNSMVKGHEVAYNKMLKKARELTSAMTGKVSSAGIKNQQELGRSIDELKTAGNALNAVNREKIKLEKQLIAAQARQEKGNRNLSRSIKQVKEQTKILNNEQRKSSGFINNMAKSMAKFTIAALGIRAVINGIRRLGTNIFETTKRLDALNFTIQAIITSQTELADTQKYLLDLTRRYGLELISTTNYYTRLRAAVRSTNLTVAQTQKIFTSVAKAGAVLGISQQRIELAFLAIEQIASKGTLSMEELRRQLGDQIPGAVNIMADALGVAIPELYRLIKANEILSEDALPKFAEQLDIAFNLDTIDRVDTLVAVQNRLKTSWQELVKEFQATPAFKNVFTFLDGVYQGIIRILRTDYENEVADQYKIASDGAKEFIRQLTSTAEQEEKILKGRIKALKLANNVLDVEDAKFQENSSQIKLMEYDLRRLKEAGKAEVGGQSYADALTNEFARVQGEISKAQKGIQETQNLLEELEKNPSRKNGTAISGESFIKGAIDPIKEANDDLAMYMEQNAWAVTYSDIIYNALNEYLLATDDVSEKTIGIINRLKAQLTDLQKQRGEAESGIKIDAIDLEIQKVEKLIESYSTLANVTKIVTDGQKEADAIAGDLFKEVEEISKGFYDEQKILENEDSENLKYKLDQDRKNQSDYYKYLGKLVDKWTVTNKDIYEDELSELETLLDEKLINEEEYNRKRIQLYVRYKLEIVQLINDAVQSFADAAVGFNHATQEQVEAVIRMHDEEISSLESKISEAERLNEKGDANNLDRLKRQLKEEEKLRNESVEQLKKLKKKEAQIELLAQTSNLITATTEIFAAHSTQGLPGVLIAIGAVASMLASVAAYKAKISASENLEQYEDGGSIDARKGGRMKGKRHSRGGIRVEVEDKEFVVNRIDAQRSNKLLEDINKGKMSDKEYQRYLYSLNFPNLFGNKSSDQQLSELQKIRAANEKMANKEAPLNPVSLGNGKALVMHGPRDIQIINTND